jgi:hypothetical protein
MMMNQRKRRRSIATPTRERSNTAGVSPNGRNELLTQIGAGVRGFETTDRNSAAEVQAFQHEVRALEALAAAGLITIGAREMASEGSAEVVAVRRIRLTEAGKRRTGVGRASSQADGL